MIARTLAARNDLIEHYVFIGRDNPDAAERFLDSAEQTFERLAGMPRSGRPWRSPNRRLAGLRVVPIADFSNYLVFYRPEDNGITIVRVLHGARDIDRVLDEA